MGGDGEHSEVRAAGVKQSLEREAGEVESNGRQGPSGAERAFEDEGVRVESERAWVSVNSSTRT
ncbi:MAG: hypothetical protein HYZ28_06240 [Myxococcales bacterium]|nr:hypothetical protein [Myxococcales bacterium]